MTKRLPQKKKKASTPVCTDRSWLKKKQVKTYISLYFISTYTLDFLLYNLYVNYCYFRQFSVAVFKRHCLLTARK